MDHTESPLGGRSGLPDGIRPRSSVSRRDNSSRVALSAGRNAKVRRRWHQAGPDGTVPVGPLRTPTPGPQSVEGRWGHAYPL
jgi:hypothetical protein